MLKNTTILLLLILLSKTQQAQTYPQLRLKTGYSAMFPSSSWKGYAFQQGSGAPKSIVLGGEYSHPFKSGKGAWHVGFTFEDVEATPFPNAKNVTSRNPSSLSSGFFFISGPAKTTVYAGFEKYLKRKNAAPSKNYFSIFGGAGVAFSLNKLTDWRVTVNGEYTTRDGGIVKGYTSDFLRSKFPVSPLAYGGLRYNITNKKGIPVFIIELVGSYSFSPFFRQTIDYTLDGVARQDILRQKGFSAQLNLIVPLYSFGKRRAKKNSFVSSH